MLGNCSPLKIFAARPHRSPPVHLPRRPRFLCARAGPSAAVRGADFAAMPGLMARRAIRQNRGGWRETDVPFSLFFLESAPIFLQARGTLPKAHRTTKSSTRRPPCKLPDVIRTDV